MTNGQFHLWWDLLAGGQVTHGGVRTGYPPARNGVMSGGATVV